MKTTEEILERLAQVAIEHPNDWSGKFCASMIAWIESDEEDDGTDSP